MINELKRLFSTISNKLKDNNHLIEYCKTLKDNKTNESEKEQIINLNIGGKKYKILKRILISIEDTLFYFLIYFNKEDNHTSIFFDRDGQYFQDIIDYYNYRRLPLKSFSEERLKILQTDAYYYNIHPLIDYINYYITPIQIEAIMTPSNIYDGENDINASLTSRQLNMGVITTTYPYSIIFKLNIDCEFDSITIKGYSGEIRPGWDSNYGSFSLIYSSIDSDNWVNIGQLPSDIRSFKTVPVLTNKGRYIKFEHHSHLGIGYLKINKC